MNNLEYQSDHLFLLIGANPLPNYVAAKLLLAEKGKPYFVYSTKTQEYAKALCDLLGADPKTCMIDLGKDGETNAWTIYKKIKEKVPSVGKIGLHYTGGTKVMSIHAYRAVRDAAGQDRKPIFSYLDSSRLCLQIERGSNNLLPINLLPNNAQQRDEMYKLIGLNLDTLWKLHGITLNPKKSGHNKSHLPEVASALAQAYGAGQRESWKQFKIQKGSIFADIEVDYIRDALHRAGYVNIDQVSNNIFYDYINPRNEKNEPFTGAKRWFEADWLEEYTLGAVLSTGLFTDARCSVETIGTKTHPQFEVDVVALRGYQLFLFSCTTADYESECKKKAV